jgi:hypothetical protein
MMIVRMPPWKLLLGRSVLTFAVLIGLAVDHSADAVGVEYTVGPEGLTIKNVGPDNPQIYDNDWFDDVVDDEYVAAKASLNGTLKGIVATYDPNNKTANLDNSFRDGENAVKVMREGGLRNVPDPVRGAEKPLKRPESGEIQETVYSRSAGSDLIVAEALKATPQKPLLVFIGGQATTVASAYLQNPTISDRVIVFHADPLGYNGADWWARSICAKKFRYVGWGPPQVWWHSGTPRTPRILPLARFSELPDNRLGDALRHWASEGAGREYLDLGDGACPVWIYRPALITAAVRQTAEFKDATEDDETFDVLSLSTTNMTAMGDEWFATMKNPKIYHAQTSNQEK